MAQIERVRIKAMKKDFQAGVQVLDQRGRPKWYWGRGATTEEALESCWKQIAEVYNEREEG